MKKRSKIIFILIIVTLISYFVFMFIHKEISKNNHKIKVSGNIEGDDVRISFRVQGQIIELLTDEGRVIKTGDTVARLNTDELTKIRDNAEATLRASIYEYELAKIDYERAENLLVAGAISTQKRDAAKTKADFLKSEVEKNRASLELAKTRLGFAELASPLNGFVLVKSALPGEVVQIGAPVFTAIDLNNIWVTAYINENDLGKVKLMQKAYIQTDSYPSKKYDGWVSFISDQAEFTPKYIQTGEERVKYVYRVKVRADNSSLELKPGMPADAYIILANDNNQSS